MITLIHELFPVFAGAYSYYLFKQLGKVRQVIKA